MKQINPKKRTPADVQLGDVFQVIDEKHASYGKFVVATINDRDEIISTIKDTFWRHQLAFIGEAVLIEDQAQGVAS